jgi:hypothetical protein
LFTPCFSLTSFQDDSTVSFLEGHLHPRYIATLVRSAHNNRSHNFGVSFHQGVQPGVDLEGEVYFFSLSQA